MKINKFLFSVLCLSLGSMAMTANCLDFHVMPPSSPTAQKTNEDVGLYSFGEGELGFNNVGMMEEEVVPNVKAIWVVGSDEALENAPPKKKGVFFSDVAVPGGAKRLNKRLSAYLGKALTKEDVVMIKGEIAVFCQERADPPVFVKIPDQDVDSGIVRFVVNKSGEN